MSVVRTPRVGVLALFHETNTFAPDTTGTEQFARRWHHGEDLRSAFAGTRTVIGGFLDAAADLGLEAVPIFGGFATPSGVVDAEVLAAARGVIEVGLDRAGELDAVFLELHGALVVDGVSDAEDALVRTVRDIVGPRPIAVVLDFHANLRHQRLADADVLVGYRTNPHVDTYEQGRRAATLLHGMLSGDQLVRVHDGIPVIAAPVRQRTDSEPLRSILQRAAQVEREHGFRDVTVHGGYSYADVPHAGMGVSITAEVDSRELAEQCAADLAAFIWELREQFRCELPDAAEAFAAATAAADRPVAVVDTGDNINGGTQGDATWLLHVAVGNPSVRTLAVVCDPDTVAQAGSAVGETIDVVLGGRSDRSVGEPVRATGQVLRVADGTFRNTGPMSTGATVSMGTVAVLRIGSCDVLVQQYPVQPNDPQLFRCAGLEPADYDVVLLKGAAAVRAGWRDIVGDFVDAGTPGITDSRLDRREYRHVQRPLWPLDG